ncbi:MAG: 30S ribosomal protein S20 [Planctomycetota bacterium]
MPNLKSAEKRVRQDAVRRVQNRGNRSRLRTALKQYIKSLETGVEAATAELPRFYEAIDVTARKNVIPKKRADRKKSRAALALERIKAGKPHGLTLDAYRSAKRPK